MLLFHDMNEADFGEGVHWTFQGASLFCGEQQKARQARRQSLLVKKTASNREMPHNIQYLAGFYIIFSIFSSSDFVLVTHAKSVNNSVKLLMKSDSISKH